MLKAHLLHNPSAGDEDHSEEELIMLIQTYGFECRYSSTKKNNRDDIKPDTDFLVIAGGDGTIRKIASEVLLTSTDKQLPIAILPKGTANNIAKSLNLKGNTEQLIERWKNQQLKKFEIGGLTYAGKSDFFLEGMGFGVFPMLMQEMKSQGKDDIENPEERIRAAWELLFDLVDSTTPFGCTINADGKSHTGKYILAEIMNIRSIGPNLILAPAADASDGILDIVLVPEEHRDQLKSYISNTLLQKNHAESGYPYPFIQAASMTMSCELNTFHVDDVLSELIPGNHLDIVNGKHHLEFLV